MNEMKCPTCGNKMLDVGWKDSLGQSVQLGDMVWITWGPDREMSATAWINMMHSHCEGHGPIGTNICLEPGTVREQGELVNHVRQGCYTTERPISDIDRCIVLYRPKPKTTEAP
jgi:hypothetical protein